jgi:methionyl-tRNA synthetase
MMIETPKRCRECGVVITGHSRREYCRHCKRIILQQSAQQKKDSSKRTVGSVDSCRVCGQDYTVRSGNQRYCSECATKVARERSNQQAQKISEQREMRRKERARRINGDQVSAGF